jgi:3',5'-cyclic-AMP phosphodiesterase
MTTSHEAQRWHAESRRPMGELPLRLWPHSAASRDVMKTYAWLTDPHLNFLSDEALTGFLEGVAAQDVDGLMLTGDIAEASSLVPIMSRLDESLPFPVYFVLGNHDYYGSSVRSTREMIAQWARDSERCHWMPQADVISLSDTTALVGHSGWGDGRVGDFLGSRISLNDYRQIEDLSALSKDALFSRLKALGSEAASYLQDTLERALESHDEVILLTHVPPFLEACWYQGQAILGEWTPHFTCGAVGDVLRSVMSSHPNKYLRVYCGHTHNGGVAQVLPNLRVDTGDAEYHQPALLSPIRVR